MTTDLYPYKTEPMVHQREGLRLLVKNNGIGGLLMEPGLGKTKTVIDYLGLRIHHFGVTTCFVAAPLSAVDTWADEVEKHLPDEYERQVVVLTGSGADKVHALRELRQPESGLLLVVTNLDVFSQSHKMPKTKTVTVRSAMADAIRAFGFDVGVVDESHRIKGHTSNVSRSLGALAPAFPSRIILTGTVAPHSPLDVFAQWRFLNQRRFGNRRSDFEDRYALKGGYMGREVVGFRNQKELRDLMSKDSLAVRKEDALDLPPVTDTVHYVRLTKKERKAYEQMEKDMVVSTKDGQQHISPSALTQWMRMRQLTSGYLSDGQDITDFGTTKVDVTTDLLRNLTANGEKVVVFAHFRYDVKRLTEAAEKAGIDVRSITGDTPQEERRTIRKWFPEGGPKVVVAQMRTVSLAINEFVAASHGVYVSMSERRDDYIQSRDRLNRNGQTKPVTFHHIMVRNSIDDDIMASHQLKGSLESLILSRINSNASLDS